MMKRIFVSGILLLWPCLIFAAANVYYSVSPFGTGDIKTGSPTISISSGVATLSVGQTGNIGQGCRITYNTSSVCYISGVTDSTHFSVVTATGGTPSNVSGQTVNSIAHEYASLSAAEAGASDASHINNTSLVAADVVLNIACYYDHDDQTADTTAMTVDGYTTSATQYINIYAPRGAAFNESINSQRHAGKWSASKYRIVSTEHWQNMITVSDQYVSIVDIQIYLSNYASKGIIQGEANGRINRCIIFGSTNSNSIGVEATGGITIANSLIYSLAGSGMHLFTFTRCYVYNCTVYGCGNGIYRHGGADNHAVINCAVFGNTDDFLDTMAIDYCASDDGDGTNAVNISPGATEATDWAAAFTDYANGDFSVKDTDSVLYNAGTDLSGTFTTDIIGTTRSSWDIGAFEYVAAGNTSKWNGITPAKWNGVDWDSIRVGK